VINALLTGGDITLRASDRAATSARRASAHAGHNPGAGPTSDRECAWQVPRRWPAPSTWVACREDGGHQLPQRTDEVLLTITTARSLACKT
jgi:hypothetical protein